MKVLIVEDDTGLATILRKGLEEEEYTVDVASDGGIARSMAAQTAYDLLLLDLNLPGLNGASLLQALRREKAAVPVLVLTASGQVEDRVRVLDLGADDYLVKPFSFQEMMARIRALLRRGPSVAGQVLRCHDLELNRVERSVHRAGKLIELTLKEFALLEYLMRNPGLQVTRTMIIEKVWNQHAGTMTNVVDVYINYLRKKIDDGFSVRLIQTVRGVGYQLGEQQPLP